MATTLLEQNKLSPCPKYPEESWKRTNPEIFFLPDIEVLNFHGQNALEAKNKLNPWKIVFQDFKNLEQALQQIERLLGKESLEALKQESKRLILIEVTHGIAHVY